jgi:Tfp pilus assembly protein FimT
MDSNDAGTAIEPFAQNRGFTRTVANRQIERSVLPRQRRQRGFSLVELIITLQFVALGGLILLPKVGALFSEYQLLSASNQLAFDIARARMQAVAQHRYVRIKMLSATQYARETSTDSTTWSNRETISLPSRVTGTPTTGELRFDKRGIAALNDPVTLKNGLEQTKIVTTNLVGRVTIARGGTK